MAKESLTLNSVDNIVRVLTILEVYQGKTISLHITQSLYNNCANNQQLMCWILPDIWERVVGTKEYPRVIKVMRESGMIVPSYKITTEGNLEVVSEYLLVPLDEEGTPNFSLLGEILCYDLSPYLSAHE
jgi:hypothetical protein